MLMPTGDFWYTITGQPFDCSERLPEKDLRGDSEWLLALVKVLTPLVNTTPPTPKAVETLEAALDKLMAMVESIPEPEKYPEEAE
jgi:hypothetical protein